MNFKQFRSPICRKCGKCCLQTEMELSNVDIKRIEQKNPYQWKKKDFSEFYDGMSHLKNIDGHCIFYNHLDKTCLIYQYRPNGCRFYPLVYNPESKECELDCDCPHHDHFQNLVQNKEKCDQLKKWIEQELIR